MAVSGFGTVYIQLDHGSYSPGQQVNGTVFLNVTQNFPDARELILTIAGMEDTLLIKECSESVSDRDGEGSTTHYYYET